MKQISAVILLLVVLSSCGDSGAKSDAEAKKAAMTGDTTTQAVPTYTIAKEVADACAPPRTVKDLDSGVQNLFYQLNVDNRMSLSAFGAVGIQLGKKEQLVIVDFVQFKDMECEAKKLRYGVGARLFLHIKSFKRGLNLSKLPDIAAEVQMGKAVVTYSIKTVGLTGDKVLAAIPDAGDFNVEAYQKVLGAVDAVRKMTKDNVEGVTIKPQLLPLEVAATNEH